MNKAFETDATARERAGRLDWRKRISDHIAFGLLVYTALNIFVTAVAMAKTDKSILPYLMLVVLVAAVIPACRWLEKVWERRGEDAAHDPALAPLFRRDAVAIWLCAIGLPFAVTALSVAAVRGF